MVGIGFKLSSVCVFLGMSSLLKASDGIPAGQLVFFRSFFALIPIFVYLLYKRELIVGVKTTHPLSHLWRGLVGTGGMMTGFFALTQLPLAEAITINYATPLLIVVFSAVFFHEQVRLYRWSAVLVGLVGVVIIIWPRLTVFSGGISDMTGATLGAMSALVSCCFAATAMVLVRRLVQTERSATIVLYFSVTSAALGLATLPFGLLRRPEHPRTPFQINHLLAGKKKSVFQPPVHLLSSRSVNSVCLARCHRSLSRNTPCKSATQRRPSPTSRAPSMRPNSPDAGTSPSAPCSSGGGWGSDRST